METIVVSEVAEAEFYRFCEENDLELDESEMDEEDAQAFSTHKKRLVKAIMRGALVIEADGLPTYQPQRVADTRPLKFQEPSGATLMAVDSRKAGADVAKTFAALAEMTGTSVNLLSKLKGIDLKICQSIFVLLMG